MADPTKLIRGALTAGRAVERPVGPLQLYHGSPKTFDEFRSPRRGDLEVHGIYGTTDRDLARKYAYPDVLYPHYHDLQGPREYALRLWMDNDRDRGKAIDELMRRKKDPAYKAEIRDLDQNDLALRYLTDDEWFKHSVRQTIGNIYDVATPLTDDNVLNWLTKKNSEFVKARTSDMPDLITELAGYKTLGEVPMQNVIDKSTAKELKRRGILGVRLPDATAEEKIWNPAQPVDSYVVFDPDDAKIIGRSNWSRGGYV